MRPESSFESTYRKIQRYRSSEQFKADHGRIHYPRGIHWTCVRCHMCCGDTRDHVRRIRLLDSEVRVTSQLTGINQERFSVLADGSEPFKFEMLKVTSGSCIFLEGDSCTIYQARPLTCRFYPFFLERNSNGKLSFGLTSERCPGLGQGPLLDRKFFLELFQEASKRLLSK